MQGGLTIFPNEAINFGTKVTDSLRNGLHRKVAYILKERKLAEAHDLIKIDGILKAKKYCQILINHIKPSENIFPHGTDFSP